MVYGLASKHFGISNLYLQLSVAVIALGNPANRERKVSVLLAGGIAVKAACNYVCLRSNLGTHVPYIYHSTECIL